MKIAFLGDSITYGGCATKPEYIYTYRVGKALGCDVDAYGVVGTRLAGQTVPSATPSFDEDFLTRAEKMGDADFVFVLAVQTITVTETPNSAKLTVPTVTPFAVRCAIWQTTLPGVTESKIYASFCRCGAMTKTIPAERTELNRKRVLR